MSFDELDPAYVDRMVERAKRRGRAIRHRRRALRASMAVIVVVAGGMFTTSQLHHPGRSRISTSAPTTTSTTATTTTTAGVGSCQPSEVKALVKVTKGQGTVLVTNSSSSSCTLDGYPSLKLLNSAGTVDASKPAVPDRAGASSQLDRGFSGAPKLVTLEPADTAVADVAWPDQSGSCLVPAKAQVTLPGQSRPLADTTIDALPDMQVCSTITAGPFTFDQESSPSTTIPTPTSATTAPPTTTSGAPAPRCKASELQVSEQADLGSADTEGFESVWTLGFTNTSTTACSLAGYSNVAVDFTGSTQSAKYGPLTAFAGRYSGHIVDHSPAGAAVEGNDVTAIGAKDSVVAPGTPLAPGATEIELFGVSTYPNGSYPYKGTFTTTLTLPDSGGTISFPAIYPFNSSPPSSTQFALVSASPNEVVQVGPFQTDEPFESIRAILPASTSPASAYKKASDEGYPGVERVTTVPQQTPED